LLQPNSTPEKSEILQSLAKEKKKEGGERTACPRLQFSLLIWKATSSATGDLRL